MDHLMISQYRRKSANTTYHAAVPYPHPDPAQQLQYRKDRRNVTDQPTAHDVTQRPRTGEDDQARLELWRGGCSDNPRFLCTVWVSSSACCALGRRPCLRYTASRGDRWE